MNKLYLLTKELNNHLNKSKDCLEQITNQVDEYQFTHYLYEIIDMIIEIEKIMKKENYNE